MIMVKTLYGQCAVCHRLYIAAPKVTATAKFKQ